MPYKSGRRSNYGAYGTHATLKFLTVGPRKAKRGEEDLAPTWWAYAVNKFLEEMGLSKGGFTEKIGREASAMRRWLYDGVVPKPGALRRIIGVIEDKWQRPGWFAKHRAEAEEWRLKQLKTAEIAQHSVFHAATQQPHTAWMDVEELLRLSGMPRVYTFPVAFEVLCSILNDAAARLEREQDESIREQLSLEISELRTKYGCD